MRYALTTILIASIIIFSSPVFAQRSSEIKSGHAQLVARMILPAKDDLVRGDVPVFGLACGEDFKKYRVEYGEGPDPKEWIEVTTSTDPQDKDVNIRDLPAGDRTLHGNLATWNTGLSNYVYGENTVDLNGIYTLRLSVYGKDGNTEEDRVTVEVGRVVSTIYGGKVESKDNRVILSIPEHAINGSFKVFGIKSVDDKDIPIPDGYRLVGRIYRIRPQGEMFVKDALLEMRYFADDLKSKDEEKFLGIYAYNPDTGNWDGLLSVRDAENNILKSPVSNITRGIAFYCILAKVAPPLTPVLYKPYSSTPLKLITIKGEAEPGVKVEIFVNDKLSGTASADKDTGIFTLDGVLLNDGKNTIYSKAADRFGGMSQPSEPIMCEVVQNPPKKIDHLWFMDENFSRRKNGPASLGGKLYIELKGQDVSPTTIDAAYARITSSASDPKGIVIQLLETGYDSGVYRGVAAVSIESSAKEAKIAARKDKEVISVRSEIDPGKRDEIVFRDMIAPSAPGIDSLSSPSLMQNTFEDGFGSWSNRDGEKGAFLSLDDSAVTSGHCLKLTSRSDRGNFSSTISPAPFDAKEYPLISFDYKIPTDVKINFLAKVKGRWYEVEFTGDPKKYNRLNMEKVGRVEGVIADDRWHSARFDLYRMLRKKLGASVVEELVMADWDEAGYMKLEYGKNKKGAAYFIDNFRITKPGVLNPDLEFSFSVKDDLGKEIEYSYCLDRNPETQPDTVSKESKDSAFYQNISDGEWYFHVRARDGAGNWGRANHYRVIIDTKGPLVDSAFPPDGSRSAGRKITLHLTDGSGAGVAPETIKLKVNDVEYDMTSPALGYDSLSGTLAFTPAFVRLLFSDKEKVTVELLRADDLCGNPMKAPFRSGFIMDYSKETVKPGPPKIYSIVSYGKDKNLASFAWNSDEPARIKGYSFIMDQDPGTEPGDGMDTAVVSKSYKDLKPGAWYFHIRCRDKSGNRSDTAHWKIEVKKLKDNPPLLVEDFNDGKDPNFVGGNNWTFTDGLAVIKIDYFDDKKNRERKNCFRITYYDVKAARDEDGAPGTYCGYLAMLNGVDVSSYNTLSFWIKGKVGGEKPNIYLDDGRNAEYAESYLDMEKYAQVATSWQRVDIPLMDFVKRGVDISRLNMLKLVFEWDDAEGVIYIDDIRFITKL